MPQRPLDVAAESACPESNPSGRPLWLELLVRLWAGPNSILGLVLALTARLAGGSLRSVGGVLEGEGPLLAWMLTTSMLPTTGAEALTLGHVVLGRNRVCLDRCRRHELVHVRQYERWGPFFLPAYVLSSLWEWFAGRDPYRDNRFEREAFTIAPLDGE